MASSVARALLVWFAAAARLLCSALARAAPSDGARARNEHRAALRTLQSPSCGHVAVIARHKCQPSADTLID